MRKILCSVVIVFTALAVFGQSKKIKFGKITKEEVAQSVYSIDTTASAIILSDIGENRIMHTNVKGFRLYKDYHIRIKILTEEGLQNATRTLFYNDKAESIHNIKGYTYNIANGKFKKTKLTKEGIFKEKLTDRGMRKVTITMPNAKVGSVIEYKFRIESDYVVNLDDWYFQSNKPVLYTSFTIKIPEYWTFKKLMSGYTHVVVDNEVKNVSIGNTAYNNNITKYTATNVKSFSRDSYMDSRENYISKVKFELKKITVPGSIYKDFNSTWSKINKNLLSNSNFGGRLGKANFIYKELSDSIKNADNDIKKLRQLYEYVNSRLKSNDYIGIYCRKPLRKIWKEKLASAPEINFTLISLLKTAGYDVFPVILKTRSRGLPHPAEIILSEYNYVIALVKLNGKDILLDATNPLLRIGTIPERCINGTGRLISENLAQEVDLEQYNLDKLTVAGSFSFDEDNRMNGDISLKFEDIGAFDVRNAYADKDEDEFIEDFTEDINGFDIESTSIENRESIYDPLVVKMKLSSVEENTNINRLIIDPVFYLKTSENPFKLKDRKYPVNYPNLLNKRVYIKIKIPEGYEVEELPKPMLMSIPGKGIVYKYQVLNMNGTLVVNMSFKTNKRKFGVEEYPALKEAYRMIVDKEAEKIVLKAKPNQA
jgi:hypothetical protein